MQDASGCIPGCWTGSLPAAPRRSRSSPPAATSTTPTRQHVREIGNWFRSTGVRFHSVHSPMHRDEEWGRSGTPPLNIASVEKLHRIAAMDEIKRAIEVAEQLPFRFLVQHVGVGNEEADEHKLEAAMSSLEHLRAFAKPLGVQLLLENIPNELSTPERLVELLHAGTSTTWACASTSATRTSCRACRRPSRVLKDHIRSTHVHDNKKDRDSHLWPGDGNIDWKETMELLRTAPQYPPLLLEIEGRRRREDCGEDGGGVRIKLETAQS